MIAREGPILANDLRQINSTGQTAEKLCDALLGMCVTHPVNPFTVTFPKPPPAHTKVFKSRGRPTVPVVHLSDVHIDRFYTVRVGESFLRKFLNGRRSEPKLTAQSRSAAEISTILQRCPRFLQVLMETPTATRRYPCLTRCWKRFSD